jgi:hypothetical protein
MYALAGHISTDRFMVTQFNGSVGAVKKIKGFEEKIYDKYR